MADFTPDQLRAGQRTPDARVNVVVDPNNLLAIGEHAASLAVVDAEGNASPAVTIRIQVVDADRPTAAIRCVAGTRHWPSLGPLDTTAGTSARSGGGNVPPAASSAGAWCRGPSLVLLPASQRCTSRPVPR